MPAPVETSLVDDLMENPIVPAAAGGLLALLLGFGVYRARKRKKSAQVDSSFLESRLQPDSFFGASGGQRIDTAEGSVTGSSMVYSPSQLDAAGDVDPVAEADVYLAYGRDLQAEEILKEALRTSPQRVAIYSKLLEIFSKRRDAKAFEQVAGDAHSLTRGEGTEWEHICELGQELDPGNPLYRPGGQPVGGARFVAAAAGASDAEKSGLVTASQVRTIDAQPATSAADLDLDLDFSLGDEDNAITAPGSAAQVTSEPTVSFAATPEPGASALDVDFGDIRVDLGEPAPVSLDLPPLQEPRPVYQNAPDLTLSENSLDFDIEPVATPAPAAVVAPAAAPADVGMIEFDLGALSLDLDPPPASTPVLITAAPPVIDEDTESVSLTSAGSPLTTAASALSTAGFDDTGGDPLATKLALAEEFNAIGDSDGARSLAEEVLVEASGELKSRAQRFLAEIG